MQTRCVRVLVVEDNERLAATVARGLEAEGFGVDVATDGPTGLWRARETAYAAIVLDILLPGMNGYEVCRTLRAEGISTPVLMLTAKTGEWDEAEALDIGADDYLKKPFSFIVLLARLRALIRRGGAKRSETLRCGPIELDLSTRVCAVDGVAVPLTTREFSVLGALMAVPGSVVSKPELLDEVWGPDFDGSPNVVDVYIGYLRRKLAAAGENGAIETVRAAGFKMRCTRWPG